MFTTFPVNIEITEVKWQWEENCFEHLVFNYHSLLKLPSNCLSTNKCASVQVGLKQVESESDLDIKYIIYSSAVCINLV